MIVKLSKNTPERLLMNRFDIVTRHNPHITKADKYSPLTVGNGEFAFTVDVTGFQTFHECYYKGIPLCTQSQWGWHTEPASNKKGEYTLDDIKYQEFDTGERKVPYPTMSEGQEEIYDWLRRNPHRLHLGRIALVLEKRNGEKTSIEDIYGIRQELNLWSGEINSTFHFEGKEVKTHVFCHPEMDALYAKVTSPLVKDGRLSVEISFPYGSSDKCAADWESKDRHESKIIKQDKTGVSIKRTLDNDIYYVKMKSESPAEITKIGKHKIRIVPDDTNEIIFAVGFGENNIEDMPQYDKAQKDCAAYWESYWQKGAMIDFSNCKDKRAFELERRVVLSQYLMAVQCAGRIPPQETGLTFNSWYGKFHLEMHWWHGVHFALWGRPKLFEKSLGWYLKVLDKAKKTAQMQGYGGARWQKMTDPNGDESPSFIGPLLIWQQPHPIYYAELLYSIKKDNETLDKYKEIVLESAKFMASYARYDEKEKRYILGPVLIPAQECHNPMDVINPTFELEYWHFGLTVANKWRERLGMTRDKKWDEICDKLSKLPAENGIYLAHENCKDTFQNYNMDHPSMLGAMGILPGNMAEIETMKNTLYKVLTEWNLEEVWGWDFPMIAMTCARLGLPDAAIDALLYDAPKNEYLINGHNKQADREDLPIYLPGNGGLLTAVAMMAAGWEGCKTKYPGFPKDGNWDIHVGEMNRAL